MSLTLRLCLIISSTITFIFCIKKIRESKLKIENSITWFVVCILLIIMSIFYEIPQWIATKLGFISPANFVFLVIIAFLLIQNFIDTIHITELNEKIKNINHHIALKENKEHRENEEK